MAYIDETGLAHVWDLVKTGFVKPSDVTLTAGTTTAGYLKTYDLKIKGTSVGVIDIPKDYFMKSAVVKTATVVDTPLAGLQIGDKYLDLEVNVSDGSGTSSHVYIKLTDLVTAYTAGNGVNIDGSNVVSVKIGTTANGLSVGVNGVELALATTTTAGAMSAADKTKLDSLVAITNAAIDTICV